MPVFHSIYRFLPRRTGMWCCIMAWPPPLHGRLSTSLLSWHLAIMCSSIYSWPSWLRASRLRWEQLYHLFFQYAALMFWCKEIKQNKTFFWMRCTFTSYRYSVLSFVGVLYKTFPHIFGIWVYAHFLCFCYNLLLSSHKLVNTQPHRHFLNNQTLKNPYFLWSFHFSYTFYNN